MYYQSSGLCSAVETVASAFGVIVALMTELMLMHYLEIEQDLKRRGIYVPSNFIDVCVSRKLSKRSLWFEDYHADQAMEFLGRYFNYVGRGLSDKQALGYIKMKAYWEQRRNEAEDW